MHGSRWSARAIVQILLLVAVPWAATAQTVCKSGGSDVFPVAVDDVVPWPAGTVLINVLANDHDPDGGAVRLVTHGPTPNGTVTISGSQISFTPAPGASFAEFSYTIEDDDVPAGQASALVTVGESGVPAGPPPLDFASSCIGVVCSFQLLTTSTLDELRETAWDFGDLQKTPPFYRSIGAFHEYAGPLAGATTKNVSVTVSYFSGATVTKTKAIQLTALADLVSFSILTSPAYNSQHNVGGVRVRLKILEARLDSSTLDFNNWAFEISWGDGTVSEPFIPGTLANHPQGKTADHVFPRPGTYQVTFRARRRKAGFPGQFDRDVPFVQSVSVVNAPPMPSFTATIGADLRTVTFDPTSSNDDENAGFGAHEWDFGDGSTAPGTIVELAPGNLRVGTITHRYAGAGPFEVTLRIVDRHGEAASLTQTLSGVTNPAPNASFFARCYGRMCRFDASASTDNSKVVTYIWDFGDGSEQMVVADNPIAGWIYRRDGCFTPKLTVVDDGLAKASATQPYTVSAVLPAKDGAALVDLHRSGATASNLNGVLEPGEKVMLELFTKNPSTTEEAFMFGTLTSIASSQPGTYRIRDGSSEYGAFVPKGGLNDCWSWDSDTSQCYAIEVVKPATRPALHWDVSVTEALQIGGDLVDRPYAVHVGASFSDVAVGSPFYPFIETLLHEGITRGCGDDRFCPGTALTREQAAVQVMSGLFKYLGQPVSLPACTSAPFADVPCSSPYAQWILALKQRGIINGCDSAGNFCPQRAMTRAEVAVTLLRALNPAQTTPACTNLFSDAPCGVHWAAPWLEEMFRRGFSGGCGTGTYCPDAAITREQFAPQLVQAFALMPVRGLCVPGAVPLPVGAASEGPPDGLPQLIHPAPVELPIQEVQQ
jgi:PKD repeat protein